ncbi:hypothetical protein GF369_04495 [Candidatus Peregrinibacteria bacterium]|nr:hypothetical protein [Candidatus Peregrinibacteria bacterium]
MRLVNVSLATIVATLVFGITPATFATPSQNIPDVSPDHPYYEAVDYLLTHDIIDGYNDGSIKPDQEITRAELLKIFVEGAIGTPETFEYNRCFNDVVILEWYTCYVCYAKAEGWVEGYEDGSFKPADPIDKAETITMLLRTQELNTPEPWYMNSDPFDDVAIQTWYGPSVSYAKENALIDTTESLFHPEQLITRGEAFDMLYRTIIFKEERAKPVTYTDDRVSFVHAGYYTQMIDETMDDEFSDMITLFTNDENDGIAFIDESNVALLEEEAEMSLAETLQEIDGVMADEIEVASGIVDYVTDYNEFFDTYDEESGTFLFTVHPSFGDGEAVYVLAHYSNQETRAELIDMFSTIRVE